jgi:hypothetical protein
MVSVAMCVINVPPRDFDVTLERNKVYEIKKYEFDKLTCGITSIRNFSNFRSSILLI